MKKLTLKSVLAGVVLAASCLTSIANASLIGHWTFENGNELKDLTGNFGDLALIGNASIANGSLDVNGSGSTTSGWARTSGYTGGAILDKTMVSWVSLDSLNGRAGSALSLDNISGDNFDGIIYSENWANKWQNGSSNGWRNSQLNANSFDTNLNTLKALVFTYDDLDDIVGGQMRIEGYLDGVSLGSYVSNVSSSWTTANAEALFGVRHTYSDSNTRGALDAKIHEARIYNTALTATEVSQLQLSSTSVPEPSTFAIFALSMMGLAARRFNKNA